MNTYGIGGNEAPRDAQEAITDIPENRTLLIENLTDEQAARPEIIEGLKTIDEVFQHYKPRVSVEFEDMDGQVQEEDLCFRNLGDFGVNGLSRQSNFLKNLSAGRDEYKKIIKQLKTNNLLRKVMSDPEKKQAFLTAVKTMIQELEQTNV